MASSHRDLVAWQRAMDLAVEVYRQSGGFPKAEAYGLVAQMRSAAISVPSNIAEGHGRGSAPDFTRFLNIARGSLREIETQIDLAHRLGFLDDDATTRLIDLCNQAGKVLTGLINAPSLRTRSSERPSASRAPSRNPKPETRNSMP
jgi:four helix bundle protein